MSNKSTYWIPFLLGLLSGALKQDDILEIKGFVEKTDHGPAIVAVDGDGLKMLISIIVSEVDNIEGLLPKNPYKDEEPE